MMDKIKGIEYEELVQFCQEGLYTMVDYIELQIDLYYDWYEWLAFHDLPRNERTASQYLEYFEDQIYI